MKTLQKIILDLTDLDFIERLFFALEILFLFGLESEHHKCGEFHSDLNIYWRIDWRNVSVFKRIKIASEFLHKDKVAIKDAPWTIQV